MGDPFRTKFLDYLCQFEGLWFSLVTILSALMFLSLFSLAFLQSSGATATILKLDLIILAFGLILAGAVLYACQNH